MNVIFFNKLVGVYFRDEFWLYFGYPSPSGPGTSINLARPRPKKRYTIRFRARPSPKKNIRSDTEPDTKISMHNAACTTQY